MKEKTIKIKMYPEKLESNYTFDFLGVDFPRVVDIREYISKNSSPECECPSKEILGLIEKYNGAELVVALIQYGYGAK